MAHKWDGWLHNPCRLGGPHRFKAGAQNHKWPTSGWDGYITRPSWGVPTASKWGAQSRVAHKWARWLHNLYRLGGPHCFTTGGRISKVDGKRAGCLRNPFRLRGPHRFNPCRLGVPTASKLGPESEVAHKWAGWLHNLCRLGVPTVSERGAKYQRWLRSGPGGYITHAAKGVPTTLERVAESQVAHKRDGWLRNPCRLGGPHCFKVGPRIKSGPQVASVAT